MVYWMLCAVFRCCSFMLDTCPPEWVMEGGDSLSIGHDEIMRNV